MPLVKVLIPLDVLQSVLKVDNGTLVGIEFNSVEQVISLGFECPQFPNNHPGYPLVVCHLEERNGRLNIIHPAHIPLSQCRRAGDA